MTSEDAYNFLCETIKRGRTNNLVDCCFDAPNFGNFVIAFTRETAERSIVCDRGQIFLCSDLSGTKNCRLAVPSLHEVMKPALLEALQLTLPPKD